MRRLTPSHHTAQRFGRAESRRKRMPTAEATHPLGSRGWRLRLRFFCSPLAASRFWLAGTGIASSAALCRAPVMAAHARKRQ